MPDYPHAQRTSADVTVSDPGAFVTLRCPFCLKLNRIDLGKAADRPRCGSCGKPMLLDRPVRVSEADFERTVLDAAGPVVVDFFADWCGPCKAMAPLMDEIARGRMGRLLVVKVDSDRAPGLSQRFDVRGIPTLIAFRDGKEVDRQVGFDPDAVRTLVDGLI
jgi:thioredoxin 2